MGNVNRDVAAELQQLCDELRLQWEPQDWGIVNADGSRLSEFLDFYQSRSNLSSNQMFELGELILASANEVLVAEGKLDERLPDFLLKNRNSFQAHILYWQGLENSSEFPVAEWLRIFVHAPTP